MIKFSAIHMFLASTFLILTLGSEVSAHDMYGTYDNSNNYDSYSYNNYYDSYASNLATECDFSTISVGVGNVRNGVVVTVDSLDSDVATCIKNTSWLGYFTNFGNSVSVEVSKTTLGVQIVATSTNSQVVTDLMNTQWSYLLTKRSPSYVTSKYSKRLSRTLPRYTPRRKVLYDQDPNYQYPQNTYPQYFYQPYTYTPPARTYVAGSSLFNTYQMYRSMTYLSNGVKVTLTSTDYRTMQALQAYYYTGLLSDFSGISVSVINISGGVEVTITSGSTSTVEQIQKIGYALTYN